MDPLFDERASAASSPRHNRTSTPAVSKAVFDIGVAAPDDGLSGAVAGRTSVHCTCPVVVDGWPQSPSSSTLPRGSTQQVWQRAEDGGSSGSTSRRHRRRQSHQQRTAAARILEDPFITSQQQTSAGHCFDESVVVPRSTPQGPRGYATGPTSIGAGTCSNLGSLVYCEAPEGPLFPAAGDLISTAPFAYPQGPASSLQFAGIGE